MAVTALSGTLLLHRQMERFLLSAYPTRWPEKERNMPVTTWSVLEPGQQMFRINITAGFHQAAARTLGSLRRGPGKALA